MNTKKIKNRASYRKFKSFLNSYKKIKTDKGFLKFLHSVIDDYRGFKSQRNSDFALESINLILKEKALK